MSNTNIELDPTGHYCDKKTDPAFLVESIGILPIWLVNGDVKDDAKEVFNKAYQFGLFEMCGGTIADNGIYSYPEDPDLYPIAEMIRGDEIIYFYPFAIVAIVSEDNTFVTRMD